VTALNKAAADADEKTVASSRRCLMMPLKTRGDKVFRHQGGKALDPLSGAEVPFTPDAEEDVINPNLLRSEMDNALAAQAVVQRRGDARPPPSRH
jgi:urea transport system permease protein